MKFEEGKLYIYGKGLSGCVYKIENGIWFFKTGDMWIKRWADPLSGQHDKFALHLRELPPVLAEMYEDSDD
jgi:hypothetical protein